MSLNTSNQPVDEEELMKTQTNSSANKRCQGCNGPLVFDPATQKLVCEFCGNEYDIPQELDEEEKAAQNQTGQANATAQTNADGTPGATATSRRIRRNRHGERPLAEAERSSCDWGVKKKMVKCQVCGAQTIYDASQTASTCPYCDSNQMMEADQQDDTMAPTGICVFRIDRSQALQQFRVWVNGLWFAPNKLKQVAQADTINGIYMPHWTFDTEASAKYKGEYGIDKKDKEGKTHTEWHACSGMVSEFIDDHLEPACSKQTNYLMNRLQPFNTNDYEDYKPEYMAGYIAERYTVTVHDSWKLAQKTLERHMDELAKKDIKRHHSSDHQRTTSVKCQFDDVQFKYLFLPIWLSSYKYNGKVYQFMVNGQTGKVEGDRPYSAWKIIFAILVAFLIVYLIVNLGGDKQAGVGLLLDEFQAWC